MLVRVRALRQVQPTCVPSWEKSCSFYCRGVAKFQAEGLQLLSEFAALLRVFWELRNAILRAAERFSCGTLFWALRNAILRALATLFWKLRNANAMRAAERYFESCGTLFWELRNAILSVAKRYFESCGALNTQMLLPNALQQLLPI